MQFYLPGDTTAWEAWEVHENGKETKIDTEMRKGKAFRIPKTQSQNTMITTGILPMFP